MNCYPEHGPRERRAQRCRRGRAGDDRRRGADRRPVHDQYRHRGRRSDRAAGGGAGARRLRARARHRQQRGSRGGGAAHPRAARPGRRRRCRWSEISISTAIGCSRSIPRAREALAKLRINPGNVGRGSKRDDQFATMIEFACRYDKPVRIGVNWGSLDPELLARMMDENARAPEPQDAAVVTRRALVASALESARQAEALGLPREAHRAFVQGERRAGPDRGLPRSRGALRLRAAPGTDRSRHGLQGHRRLDRGDGGAAAGGHRRHHPRLAHARSRAATARAK